jgi:hypothetical protein
VHDDQTAVGGGQLRVHVLVGEALDVVQVAGAVRDGEPLGVREVRIDRHRDALRRQPLDDGQQPPPLLAGRDLRGIRVTGGRPEFDDVRALGPQAPGMCDRGLRVQVQAAIREGVLGDVDDAHDSRPGRRQER